MVSILILTRNEEENIGQCLDSVSWCDDVVVVDSFSTDRTQEICSRPNVRFVQHQFDGWAAQRQWALDNLEFRHSWILSLDADEIVPSEMAQEIQARAGKEEYAAYEMRFRLMLWGKWVRRTSMYPVWITRLYRRDAVRYTTSGATDIANIDGKVGRLRTDLIHRSHKPLEYWLKKHADYAMREARARAAKEPLRLRELVGGTHIHRRQALKRLWARMPARPAAYFLLAYVGKGGFLDGKAGFRFAFLKASYEYWIDLMVEEQRGNSSGL